MQIRNLFVLIQLLTPTAFLDTISAANTVKTKDSITRSFTLTPGYFERAFNSNATMIHAPMNIMQLSSRAFDGVMSYTDNYKTLLGCVYLIPQFWLSLVNTVVYHEFGHARAHASYQVPYHYSATHYHVETTSEPITDYCFGLYIQKLFNPEYFWDGAGVIPKEQYLQDRRSFVRNVPVVVLKRYISKKPELISALKDQASIDDLNGDLFNDLEHCFDVYIDAGGLNNNSQHAKAISNLIYKRNGHLLYFFDYFAAKTTPFFYHTLLGRYGDLGVIREAYAANNMNISSRSIAFSSIAALLCSSTTWSFIYSALTALPNGSFLVYPPVWHGWRLPDLNFFITSQGLSFEITTGYQWNQNWYVGISAESVFHGESTYEFSPSVSYTLPSDAGEFIFSAELNIGKNMELGGRMGVDWQSRDQQWAAGISYIYHNALTLVGERNIPFFKNGFMNNGDISTINHEVAITVSYNY